MAGPGVAEYPPAIGHCILDAGKYFSFQMRHVSPALHAPFHRSLY